MNISEARVGGYEYGHVARSPVTLDELKQIEATIGFTDQDRACLEQAGRYLIDDAEMLVDGWRKTIGSQPHLAQWFFGPDHRPDEGYKAAVKPRFVRWVIDVFARPFDQTWLDYQQEIGLRHTPAKKNKTDRAATPEVVPLRYLIAFMAPVVESMRQHLQAKGLPAAEVDRIHAAWTKAVILSIALWSNPYTKEGLW
jgi:hypothetical protein